MADLDFGKIKLYVGNYDFWLESSQLATKLQANANAKKEEQIKSEQNILKTPRDALILMSAQKLVNS